MVVRHTCNGHPQRDNLSTTSHKSQKDLSNKKRSVSFKDGRQVSLDVSLRNTVLKQFSIQFEYRQKTRILEGKKTVARPQRSLNWRWSVRQAYAYFEYKFVNPNKTQHYPKAPSSLVSQRGSQRAGMSDVLHYTIGLRDQVVLAQFCLVR